MDNNNLNLLQKRLFIRGALVLFGTFILNSIGVWLSLYGILWWYDMPMHFFGGLFTGLLVLSFLVKYKKTAYLPTFKIVLISLVLVFLIGFIWEGYEFIIDLIFGRWQIIMDSLSDLFFDLAGGIQAVFIYLRHKKML